MLKKNTIITCPECQTPQIKSTKDLLPGQQMLDAGFVSLGFDMEGGKDGCYKCATKFIRQHPKTKVTQLHTEENGWIPLSKNPPLKAKPKLL